MERPSILRAVRPMMPNCRLRLMALAERSNWGATMVSRASSERIKEKEEIFYWKKIGTIDAKWQKWINKSPNRLHHHKKKWLKWKKLFEMLDTGAFARVTRHIFLIWTFCWWFFFPTSQWEWLCNPPISLALLWIQAIIWVPLYYPRVIYCPIWHGFAPNADAKETQ